MQFAKCLNVLRCWLASALKVFLKSEESSQSFWTPINSTVAAALAFKLCFVFRCQRAEAITVS